jgi:hypothetical protein
MANGLTVVLSGRKQSGKSTTCNYLISRYLNAREEVRLDKLNREMLERGCGRIEREAWWGISEKGELCQINKEGESVPVVIDLGKNGCKLYSFADPLKKFCIDVFGATSEQVYGTDAQKNSLIPHLLWENLPDQWRPIVENTLSPSHYVEFSGMTREASGSIKRKSGPLSGRELMQIFGTEMIRRLYPDAWARGTYNSIKNDGVTLALVTDGRFPNEILLANEVKAKTVRLLRAVADDTHPSETALDSFPLDKYTIVVDNRDMSLRDQCDFMDPIIDEWFTEAGFYDE